MFFYHGGGVELGPPDQFKERIKKERIEVCFGEKFKMGPLLHSQTEPELWKILHAPGQRTMLHRCLMFLLLCTYMYTKLHMFFIFLLIYV